MITLSDFIFHLKYIIETIFKKKKKHTNRFWSFPKSPDTVTSQEVLDPCGQREHLHSGPFSHLVSPGS